MLRRSPPFSKKPAIALLSLVNGISALPKTNAHLPKALIRFLVCFKEVQPLDLKTNSGGNHYRIVLDTKGPSAGKDAVFRSTYDVGKDKPFKALADLPDDFYSSDYYADKLIEFLGQSPKNKPFFAYLPFTAPHWPLQAPPEITKKYKGKYDDGPAELRARRLAAQVKLGLLDDGVEPYPLTGGKEWDEMTEDERKYSAKTMEVYAAMVESMDYNIGKVVKYLESMGQLDNTFIVFHSDNGAVDHEEFVS